MKPTMLLALSFLLFASTTISIFPSEAVIVCPNPAIVLDIYGDPVLPGSEYYIAEFNSEYFRVAGASNNRLYLYDEIPDATSVIISQGDRSEVVIDTAVEIKFKTIELLGSAYWKVALESPYFVTIGGYNEGYTFKLARNESLQSPFVYHLTYSTTSPFCYNATTVDIGPLDKHLVANAAAAFQFFFLPARNTTAIVTQLLKWVNPLRPNTLDYC